MIFSCCLFYDIDIYWLFSHLSTFFPFRLDTCWSWTQSIGWNKFFAYRLQGEMRRFSFCILMYDCSLFFFFFFFLMQHHIYSELNYISFFTWFCFAVLLMFGGGEGFVYYLMNIGNWCNIALMRMFVVLMLWSLIFFHFLFLGFGPCWTWTLNLWHPHPFHCHLNLKGDVVASMLMFVVLKLCSVFFSFPFLLVWSLLDLNLEPLTSPPQPLATWNWRVKLWSLLFTTQWL